MSELLSPKESLRLLIVGGAGPAPLGIDIARAAIMQARARGFIVDQTNDPDALRVTAELLTMVETSKSITPDAVDEQVSWATAMKAAGRGADVVLGLREFAQESAAEIASALGIAGNPPDVVRRVRHKDLCRNFLAEQGFRQPTVNLCDDYETAHRTFASDPHPWVVKPRDGMGSEGVHVVRYVNELRAAVGDQNGRTFIVEQFVDGPEFSVEGRFVGGRPEILAITAKRTGAEGSVVETGHVLPAPVDDEVSAAICREVYDAWVALGATSGLFHSEGWITATGIVLGEMHLRVGGDGIHAMLAYVYPGLELFGELVDDMLGRPVPRRTEPTGAAVSRFFDVRPGRLKAIHGWDEARRHPSVLYSELDVRPGDLLHPIRSSDDRAGCIVVGASTVERAEALADQLVCSVEFVVLPDLSV